MRMSAVEVAGRCGGSVVAGDPGVVVDGAMFDSRLLERGQLFVPLRAARDGHDFIADAVARGAPAYLTEGPRPADATAIEVDDALAALGRLGAAARDHLTATVVAITGSMGKTSTKELCLATFGAGTYAAPSSFNNEIGLPLTFANAPMEASAIVCEMGARGLGHVRHLCAIARPRVGIVTMVGAAHLEKFGTVAGVARAKAELPASLPENGVAVLPSASEWLAVLTDDCRADVLLFGRPGDADVMAEDVCVDAAARARFTLRSPWGTAPVRLALVGEHQVDNALAAAAAALAMGREVAEVADALSSASGPRWRMEVYDNADGVTVVNDAWNASPRSMEAALDTLRRLAMGRRSVLVLGPMAELGAESDAEHHRIGALAARVPGVEVVIAVGTAAAPMADAADAAGARVVRVDDAPGALALLREIVQPGDVVLVKGSRVAGLERVAEALR